jgi:hypothetical protein
MSVDYLKKYITEAGFDFPRLLNDDFIHPIRLLYNHKHYVSATKLLMSYIDSLGFLEFGETGENTFLKWLETFANLKPVGVTAEELWEHRNSLLHMSNLDSRRVRAGKVKRLAFYIGTLPAAIPVESKEAKYYNLFALIQAIATACGCWIQTFNANPSKCEPFFERYDLIVSDNRLFAF